MSVEPEATRPCPHCGNPVGPEMDFCPECGTRLTAAGSSFLRSCLSVAAFLFALVMGLCGSCFLFFGVIGMGTRDSLGSAALFGVIGAGALAAAYVLMRAAFGRWR